MLEFFSSYLSSFLSVAICAFICETASSLSEKGKSLSKALGLICSLCVFLAATFPILNIVKIFPAQTGKASQNTEQETQYGYEQFIELTKQQLEEKTTQDIYDNTGILIDSISIKLNIKENQLIIDSIDISVKSFSEKEKSAVSERLQTLFGNETTIIFTG